MAQAGAGEECPWMLRNLLRPSPLNPGVALAPVTAMRSAAALGVEQAARVSAGEETGSRQLPQQGELSESAQKLRLEQAQVGVRRLFPPLSSLDTLNPNCRCCWLLLLPLD